MAPSIALDATTGAEKWKFQLPNNELPSKRGVAYWPGGGDLPLPPSIIFGSTRGRALLDSRRRTARSMSGFGENGVVNLKTPEVMQTGMDVGLLAAVFADHLQESDHHRRGHRRRAGRLERWSRTCGRHARVGRADRQAGVDVPYRAAARASSATTPGAETAPRTDPASMSGAICRSMRSAASSTCRSAPRTTTASASTVPATICSRLRSSRSMRTPASISGTSSSCIMTSGTTTRSRRRCSSTCAATDRWFPPSSSSTRPG